MGKVFSFFNQKGGVGKTTSVINVAAVLAEYGKKVLIIDLDSQGNATSGVGIEKKDEDSTGYQILVENAPVSGTIKKTETENLWIVPSNAHLAGAELHLINQEKREFVLRNAVKDIEDDFDFIFIDCPPSLGLISINALLASSYIIIPLQCEYYALEGLGQLLNTYNLVRNNLGASVELGGVILTMADVRTNLTQQVIEEVRKYFNEKVFGTVIPRSVKLSEAPSFGKPAVIYDRANRGSQAYIDLGKEFLTRFSEQKRVEGSSQSAEENKPENIPQEIQDTKEETATDEVNEPQEIKTEEVEPQKTNTNNAANEQA